MCSAHASLCLYTNMVILQEGQAARTLAKYHANGGDERDPLVVFEIAQIRHALRMEEEINKNSNLGT